MSWNNAYERKKYEEKQKKQAEEYRALGMTEEQIQEIQNFDFELFKSERRFRMHTQSVEPSDFDPEEDDDEKLSILDKFRDTLTAVDDMCFVSRFWWIEEIEDEDLAKKIKSLSTADLEILTLMVMDKSKQKEIAQMMGVSVRTIERKKRQFKKLFR